MSQTDTMREDDAARTSKFVYTDDELVYDYDRKNEDDNSNRAYSQARTLSVGYFLSQSSPNSSTMTL